MQHWTALVRPSIFDLWMTTGAGPLATSNSLGTECRCFEYGLQGAKFVAGTLLRKALAEPTRRLASSIPRFAILTDPCLSASPRTIVTLHRAQATANSCCTQCSFAAV